MRRRGKYSNIQSISKHWRKELVDAHLDNVSVCFLRHVANHGRVAGIVTGTSLGIPGPLVTGGSAHSALFIWQASPLVSGAVWLYEEGICIMNAPL